MKVVMVDGDGRTGNEEEGEEKEKEEVKMWIQCIILYIVLVM